MNKNWCVHNLEFLPRTKNVLASPFSKKNLYEELDETLKANNSDYTKKDGLKGDASDFKMTDNNHQDVINNKHVKHTFQSDPVVIFCLFSRGFIEYVCSFICLNENKTTRKKMRKKKGTEMN
ncbi:hypothetical protein RFI_39575 [Reticulomyxa filosa]|uniref:Uncharacterized protein n=1 Tax=Reticulomyxa filosa TaxID=46433 RepID=X6L7S2_RETFI|nr:hypothetical protein RFI_39575 [Reticulomyxa filosa]|eukprot:ETN97947.1 hypothetical protein RFI_39575 [Reticulomyxa filosa]